MPFSPGLRCKYAFKTGRSKTLRFQCGTKRPSHYGLSFPPIAFFHFLFSTDVQHNFNTSKKKQQNISPGSKQPHRVAAVLGVLGQQVAVLSMAASTGQVARTHPSLSKSPLQSTTGPPLPIRSRVCKLTEIHETTTEQQCLHEGRDKDYTGLAKSVTAKPFISSRGCSLGPYRLFGRVLRRCQWGSACIDPTAGLKKVGKHARNVEEETIRLATFSMCKITNDKLLCTKKGWFVTGLLNRV